MKSVAFLSNGCQGSFGQVREIIAADRNFCEVDNPKQANILMVNFCAMSAESLDGFEKFRQKIVNYKKSNPNLKVIAGGCVEGLAKKRDLDFADAVYHHQGEVEALTAFLKKEINPPMSPYITHGMADITIAQGCSRRCSFCKVHFLDHMRLKSRPMEEILDLVQQAVAQGVSTIVLTAENSTEYGIDIGTNLQTLLERILAVDGVRILDVHGACLDEVTPELLETLKHPKIRMVQLEAQSLNDKIRKNMHLHKTTEEALAILGALSNKFLISNFMIGFPGHSIAEFNREMRLIKKHHLYYLTLDKYDDTPGTPSHELYQPVDQMTETYYQETFLSTIAGERQLLLKELMNKPSIEATIASIKHSTIRLLASNYNLEIFAKKSRHYYRPGNIVRVKITGLHDNMPTLIKLGVQFSSGNSPKTKRLLQTMKYFNLTSKGQSLLVDGEIIDLIP